MSHEIPRAPLSLEDAAEARLMILLAKERQQRLDDGLQNLTGIPFEFDAGIDLRTRIINWIIDVSVFIHR